MKPRLIKEEISAACVARGFQCEYHAAKSPSLWRAHGTIDGYEVELLLPEDGVSLLDLQWLADAFLQPESLRIDCCQCFPGDHVPATIEITLASNSPVLLSEEESAEILDRIEKECTERLQSTRVQRVLTEARALGLKVEE